MSSWCCGSLLSQNGSEVSKRVKFFDDMTLLIIFFKIEVPKTFLTRGPFQKFYRFRWTLCHNISIIFLSARRQKFVLLVCLYMYFTFLRVFLDFSSLHFPRFSFSLFFICCSFFLDFLNFLRVDPSAIFVDFGLFPPFSSIHFFRFFKICCYFRYRFIGIVNFFHLFYFWAFFLQFSFFIFLHFC